MSSVPFVLRWGIMSTGSMAEYFCKDLLTDPAIRDAGDVRHEIVAVAAATSHEKAVSFVRNIDAPSPISSYGSYAELNAMLALQAGKNLLCEKPFTVTAAQARESVDVAKFKKLFVMEGVWTRFLPLSKKIQKLVLSGVIGPVYRVIADLSRNKALSNGQLDYEETHRMINKDLAGGVLVGLGIYPLTWVFWILYHTQPDKNKEHPFVLAAVNQYSTGIDDMTSIICHFPRQKAMGIALSTLRVDTCIDGLGPKSPAIRIQGSKGEIQIGGPAYRPLQYTIIHNDGSYQVQVIDHPIPKDEKRDWGNGTFLEADECASCIRDGKRESQTMPWEESITIMDTIESALAQGSVKYPDVITSATYNEKSPLNTGMRII